MSTGSSQPSDGTGLFQKLQGWFSTATSEYNQVHALARKLETEAKERSDEGVIVSGFKQTILNRYYGITNLPQLFNPAMEGAKWTWYFCSAPLLNQDVEAATKDWAKSKLAVPTFENVKKAAATGLGTTPHDIERVQSSANSLVAFQTQAMGVSMGVSMGISSLLKQVGMTANSEMTRLMAMRTRTAWQFTGLLAIAYGFGKIHEAMQKSGPFEESLRKRRDTFMTGKMAEFKAITDSIKDACSEGIERGWKV